MDNKVVSTLFRFYRDRGVSVVAFNFRGVGQSTGTHGDGVGEIADAAAVLNWMASQCAARTLYLAGFSFGGYIAAALADQLACQSSINSSIQNPIHWRIKDLGLVAPAVTHYPMAALTLPANTTVYVGAQDDVVDPQAIIDWANHHGHALEIFPDTGHFFHGRLTELKTALAEHFHDWS